MLYKELIKKEIERLKTLVNRNESYGSGFIDSLLMIDGFIDNLQEEHINFPHERNIVDKVFGAGNLESWEYKEAEKLVLLAKEELLKDLESGCEADCTTKNEDLEAEIQRYFSEEKWIKKPVAEIARHFADWQHGKDFDDLLQSEMKFPKEYYERGREDMREEMMKNTVLETKVMKDDDGDGIETPYEEWLTLENTEIPSLPDSIGLKEGDRVKIIIVKN